MVGVRHVPSGGYEWNSVLGHVRRPVYAIAHGGHGESVFHRVHCRQFLERLTEGKTAETQNDHVHTAVGHEVSAHVEPHVHQD